MKVVVKDRKFQSATGLGQIRFRMWIPEDPCAAVQLTHGMAEHIERYDSLGRFLAEQGILVYGQDHAGHGRSTQEVQRGFIASEDGWKHLLSDMQTMYGIVSSEFCAIPYILLGHSMGAFLAQDCAANCEIPFEGYIFMGTSGPVKSASLIAWVMGMLSRIKGPLYVSQGLNRSMLRRFNRCIMKSGEKERTTFDWTSRDQNSVSAYVEDPLCAFYYPYSGIRDMLTGLGRISSSSWASKVRKKPILLMSGSDDPVGGKKASGVIKTAGLLTKAGHLVECRIYQDARHELLHELNVDEVYQDILLFINTIEVMGEIK